MPRHASEELFPLPAACAEGTFVPLTIIELDSINALHKEVFGPVLHVVRFRRAGLDALLADIRATGYGLTFGVHSRIDETIKRVIDGARAGNIYVNRNMVGAVVGVQPFGGEGLSGTGPKAGGPLYLRRLLAACTAPLACVPQREERALDELRIYRDWLVARGEDHAARIATRHLEASPARARIMLAGPTGEQNPYELHPRGAVLCRAESRQGALAQLAAIIATGNDGCFVENDVTSAVSAELPAKLRPRMRLVTGSPERADDEFDGALFEGEQETAVQWHRQLAAREGPIVTPQCLTPVELAAGDAGYVLERLLTERSISVNTAAAGGNASLMTRAAAENVVRPVFPALLTWINRPGERRGRRHFEPKCYGRRNTPHAVRDSAARCGSLERMLAAHRVALYAVGLTDDWPLQRALQAQLEILCRLALSLCFGGSLPGSDDPRIPTLAKLAIEIGARKRRQRVVRAQGDLAQRGLT